MKALLSVNLVIGALFVACCFYQAVYAVVRLLKKRRQFTAKRLCRYAVLIAARNEQAVIGQLLDSVREQDYPAELVDVYTVADNCTDDTAAVARAHGATVYQRQNKLQVGKGYALQYLLERIHEDHADIRYDGYFVFDADNLLDPRYITEMNKVFSNGEEVVTGYRNSKNFGDNWITAGYGMWFLRESEYLNRPRDCLGVSCAVSGTGFLFAESLLQRLGGWDYHLLTEDLEFTADLICRGHKVAYCGEAVLYDEQPRDFKLSLIQRSRWIKGYLQVIGKHGGDLVRTLAAMGRFSCYDMLMNSIPAAALTVLSLLLNSVMFAVGIAAARQEMGLFFASALASVLNSYVTLFAMGLLVLVTERRRIRCPRVKLIWYSFTFPVFVFSFGAAMLLAVFSNIEWKPIRHTVALSIGDMSHRQ